MNSQSLCYLLICLNVVFCAPYTDVKNDHRPILDVIQPEDNLVN